MEQRHVQGVAVPGLFYGTAWKEERTAELTTLALEKGFRAIDTANQRRHYFEEGVGDALAAAVDRGLVARSDVFLQTKFTFPGGQDQRLPYDPRADVATQVLQSLESSLAHLRTDVIDALVLHGPSRGRGLFDEDWQAWGAMEALQREGRVRLLGVSNVALDQLRALAAQAAVPPAFVQNRCFARTGWDRAVRALCAEKGIAYQGFSLLTANAREMEGPAVARAAARTGRTPAQVVFRFALQVGMIPLTGTSSAAHMEEDLAAAAFALTAEEVAAIERG